MVQLVRELFTTYAYTDIFIVHYDSVVQTADLTPTVLIYYTRVVNWAVVHIYNTRVVNV